MNGNRKHHRKLGLSSVSLTKARPPRDDIEVMGEIQNELEQLMVSSSYLDHAPFEWVTIVMRYGLKNEREPHYQQINKEYGDLPLAIEVDTHGLIGADRHTVKWLLMRATLDALINAGKKYSLPTEALVKHRNALISNRRLADTLDPLLE